MQKVDLGTMGIPREIAHNMITQNYLSNPASNVSPCDYNPNRNFIMKSPHAVTISKVPSKTRLQEEREQEDKIEGMLKAVFPQRHAEVSPKLGNSNIETFKTREAKKQNHTFVSGSKRTDFSNLNVMSDPGSYEVEAA